MSIVHRDLKPENIFIDAESDVRIGDFGLARHGHYQPQSKLTDIEEAYTAFTKSVGTTFYVAPEVRSAGKGIYDEKADVCKLKFESKPLFVVIVWKLMQITDCTPDVFFGNNILRNVCSYECVHFSSYFSLFRCGLDAQEVLHRVVVRKKFLR